MTRAEATARVVAAARSWFESHEPYCGCLPCHTIRALDACPPEDTDAVVAMWRDLHDARALAWAAGEMVAYERGQAASFGDVTAWRMCGEIGGEGWWPTRDAEHAAWAGRYRARPTTGCMPGAPWIPYPMPPAPAPAQRAAPEVKYSSDVEYTYEELHALDGPEDAMAMVSARLDALAAQVGQMAEQIDRLHTHSFATARLCDEHERRRQDGGPDA